MDKNIKLYFLDILKSIEEINEFVGEIRDFLVFQSDIKTRKAVERNIQIIGEAVKKIINLDTNIEITNARRIIATRNRIIHDYDNISVEIIWAIVLKELPMLKEEIESILNPK